MNYNLKSFALTLVLCIFFITLSFFSDVLNIIMYLDGGILGSLTKLISKNSTLNISALNWTINLGFLILFLILFVKSQNIFFQAIFGVLSLLFAFSFILFLNYDSQKTSSNFDNYLIKCAFYS